jgi:Transmembrane secretion effector
MLQGIFQFGLVAGPALAGVLVAMVGTRAVYGFDAASFGAATLAAWAVGPQRPEGASTPPGRRSLGEGLRYLRGRQPLLGTLVIDLNATVLGLPRALFPAMAATVFGGGATTLGLLSAAPGAGALVGAATSGWVGKVRRQGRAVTVTVTVWGCAVAGVGLVGVLPCALALLAVAGWADVVSAVLRSTIVQLSVPDNLRGRLTGVQIAVVTAGPRIGDLEAGVVGSAVSPAFAVVSGGLGSVAGALAIATALPGFRRLGRAGEDIPRAGISPPGTPGRADPTPATG